MAYDKYTFAHRLKVARVDARMNQEELAKASGVNVNGIARYELGETTPGLDKAAKLARTLGVTIDYLCGLTDERKSLA